MSFIKKINLSEKWFIFLVCLFLHLWKIGGDLPNVYNPDEPHHLNIAASYSTGDFNPHDFKYPALWSYLLSLFLGFIFVGSKLTGLVISKHDFAVQYLTNPGVFYFLVRLLSAFLVSFSIPFLYDTGLRFKNRSYARFISLFFLFTPILQSFGRDGTLYGLLIFLVAMSICQLHKLYFLGEPKHYLLSGCLIGLATGTHYLAAPMAILILSLHVARPQRIPWKWVGIGWFAASGSFLLSNPFIILDHKSFLNTIQSLHEIQNISTNHFRIFTQLRNMACFLDIFCLGALATVTGFFFCKRQDKREMLAWLFPLVICIPYFAWSYYGYLHRYSMPIQMSLLVTASIGLCALLDRFQKITGLKILIPLLVFLPSIAHSIANNFQPAYPDTRTLSKEWIENHIPSDSKILIFDPFRGPPLHMNRSQIARLYERTTRLNHPRKIYFQLLAETNPYPAYEIYSIRRTNLEAQDLPERTEKSYEAQDVLDPESVGLNGIRALGIDYLIADNILLSSRNSSAWLSDVTTHTKLAYEISPQEGKVKGPEIRIYKININK